MRPTGTTVGRVALTGAAALLLAGTAACGGSEGSDGQQGRFGAEPAARPAQALAAAAQTTREITSAEFEAVTRAPARAGGEVSMTGSLSWEDGLAMDVTVDPEGAGPVGGVVGMPDEVSVVWLDGVMYMDMGEDFAAAFGGREWMRLDLADIADATGDEGLTASMSLGLDEANQDPARQLGLLLESPDIDFVGEETVEGTPVDHYQGTITVEDALAAADGEAELLSEEERRRIVETMRDQGIDSYDIDVWVTEDDFPLRIRSAYDTSLGTVESEVTYRNLGTEVAVSPPPADSTVDFLDLVDDLAAGLGR